MFSQTIQEITIGAEGRSVGVPVWVKPGSERGAYDMLVRKQGGRSDIGMVISTEALLMQTRSKGFTLTPEKIRGELLRAGEAEESQFIGLKIRVLGQNCGYPYVDVAPLSANQELLS